VEFYGKILKPGNREKSGDGLKALRTEAVHGFPLLRENRPCQHLKTERALSIETGPGIAFSVSLGLWVNNVETWYDVH
jgi:hypothetical protein